MNALDCESLESTYASIETILEITQDKIKKVFKELDFDSYQNGSLNPNCDPEKEIYYHLKEHTRTEPIIDKVYWFHLTRTVKTNNFGGGILPLGQVVNSIWDFLFTLVKDEITLNEWKKIQGNLENGRSAKLYNLKVNKQNLRGPYAFLIRELAFKRYCWRT